MKFSHALLNTAAYIIFGVPASLLAQHSSPTIDPELAGVATSDVSGPIGGPIGAAIVSTDKHAADTKPVTDRWLDLKTLSWSGRYRNSTNADGRHLFDFGQDRYIADGRLKLDKGGNYSINFHASSGRTFNWAFADFYGGQYRDSVIAARPYKSAAQQAALTKAIAADPDGAAYKLGFPSRGGYFYFRQLYVSATPVSQITFEFGSLPIEHGQNTEITSFDDDGYMSGERIRLHDPKHLFFDQIAATGGFIGNTLTPNFFARGSDLKTNNYQQYLVEKKIGVRAVASVDYSELNKTHSMREAVALKIPEAKIIDSARFEVYQRMNDVLIGGVNFASGSGFAVFANKLIEKKVDAQVGFASVDNNYAAYSGSPYLATIGFGWNGDAYSAGKRAFTKVNWKLANGVEAFGFYTHTTTYLNPSSNIQGYNAGLNFDVKALANHSRKVL